VAPAGSEIPSAGYSTLFCRWLPGITEKLPRPTSRVSVRKKATFSEIRGRGSLSIYWGVIT
jgi:hypothetical protein